MKPEGEVARRGDYQVLEIPHAKAAELMRSHYARGASNTSVYAHGLVRREEPSELLGAAIWLPPPAGAAKLGARLARAQAFEVEPQDVLALSRLFVRQGQPQNATSILLSQSTRLVFANRRYKVLLTYADSSQGHTGVIYRATNWLDAGETEPTPLYLDSDGRQVSPISSYGRSGGRRLTTTLNRQQMSERGARFEGMFSKRRFVMFSPFIRRGIQ